MQSSKKSVERKLNEEDSAKAIINNYYNDEIAIRCILYSLRNRLFIIHRDY